MTQLGKAACIGGGVIGGGWAARFLLAGIDVAVHDPDPRVERIVGEVVANAERAYAKLTMAPLPPRGRLDFAPSVAEAVAGADWVQESVPERLELKRDILAEIDSAAAADALIGSSTSGLLPSDLQAGLARPERVFVAHPYNPVYLLPLVELVGGQRTDPDILARARTALDGIGMKGVVVNKEIDAFVGDRLLEALWREALWLVKDDVCDVATLDDVMRYSFGLRWAQMGLFQTYRIAGGEAGMRHFLAQFGPALKWPWSKLTDVPALTDELIEKIGRQSDDQAAGRSLRELEQIRDDNLVAILQGLKGAEDGRGWGAGALLKDFEDKLWAAAADTENEDGDDPDRPLRLLSTRVGPAWIDYNGHMTEHRYLQVFGDTADVLLRRIGVTAGYLSAGHSYYTVETRLRYMAEAKLGQALYVTTQILAAGEVKLRLFHRMHDAATDEIIATAEQMLLHVDTRAKRTVPVPAAILARLIPIAEAHAALPRP